MINNEIIYNNMKLVYNIQFEYNGFGEVYSTCKVRLIKVITSETIEDIVIMTENEDTMGTSVTNFVENLIPRLMSFFNIGYDKTIWIEHYDYDRMGYPTFDYVTLTPGNNGTFSNPIWERVDKFNVKEIEKIENTINRG